MIHTFSRTLIVFPSAEFDVGSRIDLMETKVAEEKNPISILELLLTGACALEYDVLGFDWQLVSFTGIIRNYFWLFGICFVAENKTVDFSRFVYLSVYNWSLRGLLGTKKWVTLIFFFFSPFSYSIIISVLGNMPELRYNEQETKKKSVISA